VSPLLPLLLVCFIRLVYFGRLQFNYAEKTKKPRGNKGLIFAHHFGVVRCEKGRAPEWDGNMPWHHEGN